MKNNKKTALIALIIASAVLANPSAFCRGGGGHGSGHHHGGGGHGSGRHGGGGHGGHRGGHGGYHRSGSHWGRVGIGTGFGTGFWGRSAWNGWHGPHWGPSGLWLGYGSYWGYEKGWPRIHNQTGERIKFYVSDRHNSRYTLTVVTEDGQTKTFTALEIPEMRSVDLIIDSDGDLQVVPR